MLTKIKPTDITLWDGRAIPRLGMGCWAIGGPFYAGDVPLGWGDVDDAESIRAIHRAIDLGIRFFDTASNYGAGHSEEVLGTALEEHPDIVVATKFGFATDYATKQATGAFASPDFIRASLETSLKRLGRERIDLLQFHLNNSTPSKPMKSSTRSTPCALKARSRPMAGARIGRNAPPASPIAKASFPSSTR
ncbi:aryl-alcohol dehydrogenase-like predicted oxidoreductase [Rhizobium giardinii]|uniref:Aryl-alcohol dehydrogenase-like predicted oxidoreductase n=1 Tax=Rhizobium giardinii TaxID=56731 RepID=A0A7W8X8N0_9HYPH|nr:aryl-alcohol dehydrogenase-like predicted oxidoreductase [Rhizobium giardinii]